MNEKTPAIRRVNAILRKVLPAPVGNPDYLNCVASSLGAQGANGDYSVSLSPAMITSRWLAVSGGAGGYCGGAHPYFDEFRRTFDLISGKEVELSSWFGGAGLSADKDEAGKITEALRAQILKHAPKPETDCEGVLASSDYWTIGLTRRGMIFIPGLPHAALGCSEEISVPYAELSRFLNATGKAGVISVLADLK